MPYQKKYQKKKNYYGPVAKRVDVYGRAGMQLAKDVAYLGTLINSEMHSFMLVTSGNIDSVGVTHSFCNVPQGDGENERTGNSILPRYLSLQMNVNKRLTALGTVDHETIRVILFRYWGEATSAAPVVTAAEILDSFGGIGPRNFLNEDNTGKRGDRDRRIEIHKSKLFTLDSVSSTSRTWKWNIEVNGLNKKVKDHIKFRSDVTEAPVSGGFFILFISDNATGANKSAFSLQSKINFHDN